MSCSVYLNEISSLYNIFYITDAILFFVAALQIFSSVLTCIQFIFLNFKTFKLGKIDAFLNKSLASSLIWFLVYLYDDKKTVDKE